MIRIIYYLFLACLYLSSSSSELPVIITGQAESECNISSHSESEGICIYKLLAQNEQAPHVNTSINDLSLPEHTLYADTASDTLPLFDNNTSASDLMRYLTHVSTVEAVKEEKPAVDLFKDALLLDDPRLKLFALKDAVQRDHALLDQVVEAAEQVGLSQEVAWSFFATPESLDKLSLSINDSPEKRSLMVINGFNELSTFELVDHQAWHEMTTSLLGAELELDNHRLREFVRLKLFAAVSPSEQANYNKQALIDFIEQAHAKKMCRSIWDLVGNTRPDASLSAGLSEGGFCIKTNDPNNPDSIISVVDENCTNSPHFGERSISTALLSKEKRKRLFIKYANTHKLGASNEYATRTIYAIAERSAKKYKVTHSVISNKLQPALVRVIEIAGSTDAELARRDRTRRQDFAQDQLTNTIINNILATQDRIQKPGNDSGLTYVHIPYV